MLSITIETKLGMVWHHLGSLKAEIPSNIQILYRVITFKLPGSSEVTGINNYKIQLKFLKLHGKEQISSTLFSFEAIIGTTVALHKGTC